MAYVVTDACTKCLKCTEVCPVSCIHPGQGEDGFDEARQVCIDPDECIDCGACVAECPAEAIFPADELPADKQAFIQVNADRYGRT